MIRYIILAATVYFLIGVLGYQIGWVSRGACDYGAIIQGAKK